MPADVDLFTYLRPGLYVGIIVFLRIGASVALLPAFGEMFIPQRVRLAVAVVFTMIVAPTVGPLGIPDRWAEFLPLFVSEAAIGMVFGLLLRLTVIALQMAGSMAAQSTSLAQLFGGSNNEPLPAFGHVFVLAGLTLAVISDLHVLVAEAIIDSYRVFPVGSVMDPGILTELVVSRIADAFGFAFALASPFVVAAFIYNLALGAINRAMPQLMVVLVGAPAITGAALAGLALLSPLLLRVWMTMLERVLSNSFGV